MLRSILVSPRRTESENGNPCCGCRRHTDITAGAVGNIQHPTKDLPTSSGVYLIHIAHISRGRCGVHKSALSLDVPYDVCHGVSARPFGNCRNIVHIQLSEFIIGRHLGGCLASLNLGDDKPPHKDVLYSCGIVFDASGWRSSCVLNHNAKV